MTRTTLKALWFGGGGILAAWVAVTPQGSVPAPTGAGARQAIESDQRADDLSAQTDRLRERTAAAALRPSTRNPFRFSPPKSPAPSSAPGPADPPMTLAPVPAAPPALDLKLSGVTQTAGRRTAVITSGSQLYIVSEGDSLAGRYTVVTIDPEAALLRDADGMELRLVLP
jgi:hypothetical protein